jgi:hypothetical protein
LVFDDPIPPNAKAMPSPAGLWLSPSKKRPGLIEPCIPTLVSRPTAGLQWLHEIKHDGYRLIARKTDGRVRLFTRHGYDWTDRYPPSPRRWPRSGPPRSPSTVRRSTLFFPAGNDTAALASAFATISY